MKIRSHWRACQRGYAPHYSYQEPKLTPVARPLPAASHLSSLSPLSSSPSPFVHSLHACLCVLNKMNLSDVQRGLRSWQITGGPLTLAFFSRCLIVSDDKMPIRFLITICDICIHLVFHIYYFPGGAPSWQFRSLWIFQTVQQSW